MEKPVTLAGFIEFVRNFMGLSTTVIPDDSPSLRFCLEIAKETVWNPGHVLRGLYPVAVYNLAANYLVYLAPDDPNDPSKFFTTYRAANHLNSVQIGLIQAAHDQNTGNSLVIPARLEQMTLANLQQLQTPWGSMYLQIIQSLGNVWGIT